MEKAILKTLIYADIFDYPLKAYEIHKWLIGRQISLQQVEKALEKLVKQRKVKSKKEYFFLNGREQLVRKRLIRKKQSSKFLLKAKIITWFLKIIPTLNLVGISGGLAMENAGGGDDIDLILVTSKNRLWISRLLAVILLDLLGVRRKAKMIPKNAAGKLCLNILLEEDRLAQEKYDIYIAHEILQMKVLWHRGGVYKKYLEENQLAFKYLPNWISTKNVTKITRDVRNTYQPDRLMWLENLARKFQLMIMQKPQGMERIEDGALYFHPNDIRPQVLKEYGDRIKKFSTP